MADKLLDEALAAAIKRREIMRQDVPDELRRAAPAVTPAPAVPASAAQTGAEPVAAPAEVDPTQAVCEYPDGSTQPRNADGTCPPMANAPKAPVESPHVEPMREIAVNLFGTYEGLDKDQIKQVRESYINDVAQRESSSKKGVHFRDVQRPLFASVPASFAPPEKADTAGRVVTIDDRIRAADKESGVLEETASLGGALAGGVVKGGAGFLAFAADAADYVVDLGAIGVAATAEWTGLADEGFTDQIRRHVNDTSAAGFIDRKTHDAATDALQGGAAALAQDITAATETEGDKLRNAKLSKLMSDGDYGGVARMAVSENPRVLVQTLMSSVGYMVGGGGVAGAGRKAAQLTAKAVTRSAAKVGANPRVVTAAAQAAKAQTPTMAALGRYAGRAKATLIGGGGAAAADMSYEAEQAVKRMTPMELRTSMQYGATKKMLTQHLGEEPSDAQIRESMARASGSVAYGYGLAGGAIAALIPGGVAAEKLFTQGLRRGLSQKLADSTTRSVISGAAREGASEAIEEYVQGVASREAAQAVYSENPKGVEAIGKFVGDLASFEKQEVSQAVMGAILGGVMGGGIQLKSPSRADTSDTSDTDTTAPEALPPLSDASARVLADLAANPEAAIPDGVDAGLVKHLRAAHSSLPVTPDSVATLRDIVEGVNRVVDATGQEVDTDAAVATAIDLYNTNEVAALAEGGESETGAPAASLGYEFAIPDTVASHERAALEALLTEDNEAIGASRFLHDSTAGNIEAVFGVEIPTENHPVFGEVAAHHAWAVSETSVGETLVFSDSQTRIVKLASGETLSYSKGSANPITLTDAKAGKVEGEAADTLIAVTTYTQPASTPAPTANTDPLATPVPADNTGRAPTADPLAAPTTSDGDPQVAPADEFTPQELDELLAGAEIPAVDADKVRTRVGVALSQQDASKTAEIRADPDTPPAVASALVTEEKRMLVREIEAPDLTTTERDLLQRDADLRDALRSPAPVARKPVSQTVTLAPTTVPSAVDTTVEQARLDWLVAAIRQGNLEGDSAAVDALQHHAEFDTAAMLAASPTPQPMTVEQAIEATKAAEQNLNTVVAARAAAIQKALPAEVAAAANANVGIAGRTISREQARSLEARMRREWPASSNMQLTVVERETDIPAQYRGARTGFKGITHIDTDGKGRVFLVRNRLASYKDAYSTLAHEVIGHYGMEALVPAEKMQVLYGKLRKQAAAGNKSLQAVFKEVDTLYPEASTLTKAREVLARAADINPQSNGFKLAAELLGNALKGAGIPINNKTAAQEVVQLYREAGQLVKRGDAVVTGRDGPVTLEARAAKVGVPHKNESFDYVNRGIEAEAHVGQRLKESKWDAIHTTWVDHVGRVRKVQRFVEEKIGEPITPEQDVYADLSRMKTRAAVLNDLDVEEVAEPFLLKVAALAKKTGRDSENIVHAFDNYMVAKHAIERNKIFYLMMVPLQSEGARAERVAVMNGVYAGTLPREQAIAQLTALVDQHVLKGDNPREVAHRLASSRVVNEINAGTLTRAEAKTKYAELMQLYAQNPPQTAERDAYLRSLSLSGVSNKDALETLAEFKREGMAAHMEELVPAFRAITERTRQRNTESGMFGDGGNNVLDFYGFKYYVPLKGKVETGETDGDQAAAIRAIEWDSSGDTVYNGYNAGASVAEGRSTDARDANSPTFVALSDMANASRRMAMNETMETLVNFTAAHGQHINAVATDLGHAVFVDDGTPRWKLPARRSTANNNVFTYLKDGSVTEVAIGDLSYASALLPVSSGSTLKPVRLLGQTTKLMGRFMTTLKPAFWSVQAMRDIQNAIIVTAGEHGVDIASKTAAKIFSPANVALAARYYSADAVGRKAMAKKHKGNSFLQHMHERFESGGHIYFSQHTDATVGSRLQADRFLRLKNKETMRGVKSSPLHKFAPKLAETAGMAVLQGHEGASKLFNAMNRVSGFVDNFTRDAVYATMVNSGMGKKSAALYARKIADFNQQTKGSQVAGSAFLFWQPAVIGAQRTLQAIFKGGQVPLTFEQNADGTYESKIDPKKLAGSLNIPFILALMAKGAVGYSLAASMLGDDDDGVPIISKQRAGTLALNELWAMTDDDGHVLKIPRQYGVQMVFEALGTLAAAQQAGHKTMEEVQAAMGSVLTMNLTPASPAARVDTDLESSVSLDSLGMSAVPSLLRPILETTLNRNTFGGMIHPNDRADKVRHLSDFSTTPEGWRDVAKVGYESTGIDLHPETYRHLAMSYVGGLVGPLNQIMRNAIHEADGTKVDTYNPLHWSSALPVLRWSRDAEFYPRELNDTVSRKFHAHQRLQQVVQEDGDTAISEDFLRDRPGFDKLKSLHNTMVSGSNSHSQVRELSKRIAAIRRKDPADRAMQIPDLVARRDQVFLEFAEKASDIMKDWPKP